MASPPETDCVIVTFSSSGPTAGPLVEQARLAYIEGDLTRARDLLRQALAAEPANREAADLLARVAAEETRPRPGQPGVARAAGQIRAARGILVGVLILELARFWTGLQIDLGDLAGSWVPMPPHGHMVNLASPAGAVVGIVLHVLELVLVLSGVAVAFMFLGRRRRQ